MSDVVLSIDKTLISRAIENLIINAMQAVPQQGGRIRVTAFENESHVCIVVDDNGPGVDPELGDSIYQRQRECAKRARVLTSPWFRECYRLTTVTWSTVPPPWVVQDSGPDTRGPRGGRGGSACVSW